ncbi:MAG TPA: tRNA dihydrouridine synthase DusB [Bacilli bacterium]|nr:tRNA dihydrouridine synthase DusB [Bacilli bacterium]HPA98624.1 tRNA dihydrouridine synthase DusB [Bacilli bacterium]HQM17920.1 tRNA dihydrouridine synthase DusB [Bacilli bacterium]HQO93563.1 tRNA dihydrouridine synthase DusB [Bacilli bacterium]HQQ38689.1 tRNA dihydrouridine synthase DusB [Bacilli bacterium]
MKIGKFELKNKVIIAPLAGYTNYSYRKIMREFGASLCYTEMISAKGINFKNKRTLEMTKVKEDDHLVNMQLFGGTKEDLVKAAIYIDKYSDCDIIDLNMGCPVKKVLKAKSGSYLLKDPDNIYEIVKAVVESVSKPVTVKIRLGQTKNTINVLEVAKKIEKAGASAICIHGRTQSDLYKGKANYDYIRIVKEQVKIPVIANGDIKSIEDAKYVLDYTKCDAIMIGRSSIGNPWLIQNIVNHFEGKELLEPTAIEKIQMVKKHYALLKDEMGEKLAILNLRSLFSRYLKGLDVKEYKLRLMKITKEQEMNDLFKEMEVKYENS